MPDRPEFRPPQRLALFDLDHTLLSGDSDVLWCEFLLAQGALDPSWRERCAAAAAGYTAGTTAPQAYCDFHASTLAGRSAAELLPLRRRFLDEQVLPRIPPDAHALLRRHRDAGDRLVLTTATNRVVSELTALALGIDDYLGTELEIVAGRYTGRTRGVLNMRTGKVERLRAWLHEQALPDTTLRQAASFYSDSINDLPLLSAVRWPVVVDPDPRLESAALRKGWKVLRLRR
ncbi:MAG: HAD-IB family hydrolase [Burkholderiales bacterium]|nr:HAD-IB family hydrolase [Burkholderiales bacterium]